MTSQQDGKAIRQALRWESYPARGVRYAVRPDLPWREPGDDQGGPSDPTPAGDPQEAVRLLGGYLRLKARIEYGLDDDDQTGDAEPVSRADALAAELPAPLPEPDRTGIERRLGVALPPGDPR